MGLTLKPHQYKVIEYLIKNNIKKHIIWADTGTGKTIIGLTLISLFEPKKCLILTKPILITNAWLFDNERFFNHNITPLVKENITEPKNKDGIYIISYDLYRIYKDKLKSINWDLVILDESHLIGNRKSSRSKALVGTIRHTADGLKRTGAIKGKRIYLLTGTLRPNRHEQVYPQISLVGYRETWTNFQNKFFIHPNPMMPYIIKFKSSMKDEFNKLVSKYSYVIKHSNTELKNIKKHWIEIEFPLKKKDYDIYYKLKKTGIFYYNDKKIDLNSDSVSVKYNIGIISKLRQIARGFFMYEIPVIDENGLQKFDDKMNPIVEKKIIELDIKTVKLFIDFLTNDDLVYNEPIIVWYNFDYELKRILDYLPKDIPYYIINGKQTKKKVNTAISEFKKAKKGVCFIQYMSGKNGLTFTNCRKMVFYSLVDDNEAFEQAQDRIYRIGQTQDVYYYVFLAYNTIDKVIYKSLKQKKNINEALKDYILNEEV